ncbi:MAG: NAD(P)-dependent oxidoreductase [Coriobacteriales bacterium]|nr:NAD(P)-dependent oxidoreductase [Coriobacteriales bacterium]
MSEPARRPTILVVGSSGFLGSHLAARMSRSHEVFCASRHRPSQGGCGHWVCYDAVRPETIDNLPARVDVVYYMAMSPHYRAFPAHAKDVWDVNVQGLFSLLEYARASQALCFVLASSGSVYQTGPGPVSEDSPLAIGSGCDFYASSKIAAEALLNAYAPYFHIGCLRFFYPYGHGLSAAMLFRRMMHNIGEDLPIVLDGQDGFQSNPVYLDDAIDACVAAAGLEGFHTINVAGPETVSLGRICRIISDLLGKPTAPRFQYRGEERTTVTRIDRMCELLGAPKTGILDGLRQFVDAYRTQGADR